ncbi:jg10099 [Pararge aegeria aegeria]|uniref:Jg10099 protein n=1 Tax=Pararge aegeria aegeria TaxID=348720 RepID=A0A8S4SI98_9NEOP|nr:jg10099 [Pararge aegeria aegeria]
MQSNEKRPKTMDLASLEPAARVKQLANFGAMVEVDPNVPPRRYYRSGLEMVRMANVYLAEGSLENAYMLYLKFMTLFLEKIRKHPEYVAVPSDVKAVNQAMLKEVMPKAEKLKQKLLDQYAKEHANYKEYEEKRKIAEAAKRKQEQEDAKLAQRLQADENRQDGHTTPHLLNAEEWAVSPSAPPVDGVLYPDDFASEPPRAPPQSYHPTPPLIPPSRPHDAGINDFVSPLVSERRLRQVVVPAGLLSRFLALAAPNTARNVELCGILAGILVCVYPY